MIGDVDYQGFAKPSRLFPATEVKIDKEIPQDEKPNPRSQSLFKIKIQTSMAYDSGFSDINAGLLICIIDENGDSVLQRIPAVGKLASSSKPELNPSSVLHFQRGSVDEFTFEGPRLGNIRALWISLESGLKNQDCSLWIYLFILYQNTTFLRFVMI